MPKDLNNPLAEHVPTTPAAIQFVELVKSAWRTENPTKFQLVIFDIQSLLENYKYNVAFKQMLRALEPMELISLHLKSRYIGAHVDGRFFKIYCILYGKTFAPVIYNFFQAES